MCFLPTRKINLKEVEGRNLEDLRLSKYPLDDKTNQKNNGQDDAAYDNKFHDLTFRFNSANHE